MHMRVFYEEAGGSVAWILRIRNALQLKRFMYMTLCCMHQCVHGWLTNAANSTADTIVLTKADEYLAGTCIASIGLLVVLVLMPTLQGACCKCNGDLNAYLFLL